jgi:hypothetical protein
VRDPIETTALSARNTMTGARITADITPIDWRIADYWYESPEFGLKFGFEARWIYDLRPVEVRGTIKEWNVCIGIILKAGFLRMQIERAIAESTTPPSKNDGVSIYPEATLRAGSVLGEAQKAHVIADCYALLRGSITAYGVYYAAHPEANFAIYEAEATRFSAIPRLPEAGPDAIAASQAIRVI